MSRKLEDLIPILAIRAQCLKDECKSFVGVEIIYTDTWRSFAEQESLYAQGRTAPGNIVTWAKAGESYHNYGLAFDFVPIVDGKADWKDESKFVKVGEYAEDGHLQWGGRWPGKKRDLPHIQMSFGFSIMELQKFYSEGGIQKVWQECNKKYEAGLWP